MSIVRSIRALFIVPLASTRYRRGLVAALLLHLAIVSLYVFSVIPQQYHPPEHLFWLHNGGDNTGYYALAHDIYNLSFATPSQFPLGMPLLSAPFVALSPTSDLNALTQIIAAFWTLVMFPVGQWMLGDITCRLTGKRGLALVAVLLWTVLPLIFWAGLWLLDLPSIAETASVHLLWAQFLSDGPTALFTLLIVAAWLRLRDEKQPLVWMVVLGVLCGFIFMVRYTGVLIAGAVWTGLLMERHWKAALIVPTVALIAALPQFAYHIHFFGSPFLTGYTEAGELRIPMFSLSYLLDGMGQIWDRLGLLLPLGAAAAILLLGSGIAGLWKHDRTGAVIIALWIAGYGITYSLYFHSYQGGLPRFWIPLYPAIMVAGAGLLNLRHTGNTTL